MTDDLDAMSTEQLHEVLDEAEAQLREIRAELERREAEAQHAAIDRLAFPATRTAVDWTAVRAFFRQVLDDVRGGKA